MTVKLPVLFTLLLCCGVGGCTERTDESPDRESRGGAEIFVQYCAACHGDKGEGIEGVFPRLADSRVWSDKERVSHSVVNGLTGAVEIDGIQYNGVMPPLPPDYSDAEAAAVINWVAQAFGSATWSISAKEVAAIRE